MIKSEIVAYNKAYAAEFKTFLTSLGSKLVRKSAEMTFSRGVEYAQNMGKSYFELKRNEYQNTDTIPTYEFSDEFIRASVAFNSATTDY